MDSKWRDLILLYQQERKAFLYFAILIGLIVVAKITIPYWYPHKTYSIEELEQMVEVVYRDSVTSKKQLPTYSALVDVNTDSIQHWTHLGFSPKQSKVIVGYKNSIGGFNSVNQLLDVFVVDSTKFKSIKRNLIVSIPAKGLPEDILSKDKSTEANKIELSLKPFDPNTITAEAMYHMGFSKIQANNVINYRSKVAKFKNEVDFKKLYAFSETEMDIILPYVVIKEVEKPINGEQHNKIESIQQPLNINTCDSIQLIALKGIGPFYAKQILKYRDKLGGYVSVKQLFEVPKMRRENIEVNLQYLFVADGFVPKQLDLNHAQFKQFTAHPYFEYYYTKKIFDYKNKHGNFTSLRDLKKVGFVESDYIDKVSPYLKIE